MENLGLPKELRRKKLGAAGGRVMTISPEEDLAKHIRLMVDYDDGSTDVFAVPEATLQQGASEVVRMIAEWQREVLKSRSDCWRAGAEGVCAELDPC